MFDTATGVNDLALRYTQKIYDQPARKTELMDRPFYIAGSELNGAVIQQCPGSEIMVVDFDKDRHLKSFYQDTLVELKRRGWGTIMMPNLVNDMVVAKVRYDLDFVNALTDGRAAELDANKLGVDRSRIDALRALPPLANTKFYVGEYLNLGIGVCRQMGVIAAATMERAIKSGDCPAWKNVEYRGLYGAVDPHAWAVVQGHSNQEVIIDPANNFCGNARNGKYDYSGGYAGHVFGKPNT